MATKKTDISQIRKYLEGELDAHAMHQLEREAQDDPFLMDAMDGFEMWGGVQQTSLDDLDKRLEERVGQSKIRRMVSWKYYAAAASVIIVFTLGYLLWSVGQKSEVKQRVAQQIENPPVVKQDTLTPPVVNKQSVTTVIQPVVTKPRQEYKTAAAKTDEVAAIKIDEPVTNAGIKTATDIPAAANPAVKTDKEMIYGYNTATADSVAGMRLLAKTRKADSSHVLKEITIPGLAKLEQKDLANKTAAAPQTLQGKVVGADVTTPKKVSGYILDQLGLPLPGATVKLTGTDKQTQTDANGHFSLPTNGQATVDVRSIGYEAKRVEAKGDEDLSIKLKEDNKSLSEVVVTGKSKTIIKDAHPNMGWDGYNKYLKAKAIAATTGTVQLSFTVDAQGRLSDFHIVKGLNEATDQQAVELVKTGPSWVADTSGQAKTIKLKISFSKE